jgi:4a-hydroxytetrahydrobiopterin dehydratase
VDSVAQAAEKMDHHPDLDIRYTKITAVLSTHSSGGITANDVKLAKEMDRLAS